MTQATRSSWRSILLGFSCAVTLACSGGRDDAGASNTGASFTTGLSTTGATASATAGGASGTASGASGTAGGGASGASGSGNTTGVKFDVGMGDTAAPTSGGDDGPDCDPDGPGPTTATLEGTVFAPNMEVPVSGVLVYTRQGFPLAVPDGVYCAECVGIPCNRHFVLTEPDGSFSLPVNPGRQTLVVTKGQFMRAIQIDVVAGTNQIAPTDSSLPGVWNPPEGQWIPRMAVVDDNIDDIENVLAKLGLGMVDANGELIPGTEQFDHLQKGPGVDMLENLDAMRKYHIIFMPCQGPGRLNIEGNGAMQQNIRDWVAEGGKWYVTDWTNEYLYLPFPSYQTFHQQATNPDLDPYDATATVLDPDLHAWLEALPPNLKDIGGFFPDLFSLPQVEVEDNWSGLDETPSVIVQDNDGNNVDVGHYAWVEGPCLTCTDTTAIRPMTITASYGCGRMLFSTYHTSGYGHLGLSPQELILLYIILEIGVCHSTPPPPPPPQDQGPWRKIL